MKQNKVLVIGYVWPEPKSSAAGMHILSIMRQFIKHDWQVTFVTPAQRTEHMVDLSLEGINSDEILLNDSSFDEYIQEYSPDCVVFDRFMMEEQFGWRVEQSCPNAIRILDTEDLQCLRGAREKALKEERTMLLSDLYASDLAKREVAAILRCDLSLIISDYEIELLQQSFKVDKSLLFHLPFMLDEFSKPVEPRLFSQRNHFVTIGNFRHAPNWDSVLYLQQIWPLIRKQIPQAELHIYGSYPPKKATQLNNPQTGFLVKGWAEDAFEVLSQARVCLAPLRFGAGIKGKLIDSMLVSTPSVTTDIGVEGMAGEFEWPGLVANDAESIAASAVRLYQDESLWKSKQSQMLPLLQQRYDAKKLSEELMSRIESISTNLEQHRQQNFLGGMLLHHTMRSTKFMSKWIELKQQLNK